MRILADQRHPLAIGHSVIRTIHRLPDRMYDIDRPQVIGQLQVDLVGDTDHLFEKLDNSRPIFFARHDHQGSARMVFVKVEKPVERIKQCRIDPRFPRSAQHLTKPRPTLLVLAEHHLARGHRYNHPGDLNVPLRQLHRETLTIVTRQTTALGKTRHRANIQENIIHAHIAALAGNFVRVARTRMYPYTHLSLSFAIKKCTTLALLHSLFRLPASSPLLC